MTNNQAGVTLRRIAFKNSMIVHFKVVQVLLSYVAHVCVHVGVCVHMCLPEMFSSVIHYLLCRGYQAGFLT